MGGPGEFEEGQDRDVTITSSFTSPHTRLLHLFAAQGLRWSAYAAAEVLQGCGQLDIQEHQGKVRGRSSRKGTGQWRCMSQSHILTPFSPQTPLLVAATANQPLIVQDLLTLGADPNATDHRGRTILHLAATYGLPGVLTVRMAPGCLGSWRLAFRVLRGTICWHPEWVGDRVSERPRDPEREKGDWRPSSQGTWGEH